MRNAEQSDTEGSGSGGEHGAELVPAAAESD
jgi:hypothetical protein